MKKTKSEIRISYFVFRAFSAVALFLLLAAPTAAQQESTSSVRDLVREKVKEKLENLTRKPTATVGILEQITDSTLEIKTKENKALLASTTKDTLYFRISAGKKKEIKFDELILGEFVVAMGFRNGNEVLEAKRVVTHDKSPIVNKHSVYGVVKATDKSTLTVEHPKTRETWTVKTSSKTTVTAKVDSKMQEVGFDAIKIGDRVTAVGILDSKAQNTLEAKRVHVIPGLARGLLSPTPKPTKKPTPTGVDNQP